MASNDVLFRRSKNEAAAVYEILTPDEDGLLRKGSPLTRYVVSASGTRNLINFPEILNRHFTEEMVRGLTYAFIGLDRLENLSTISSKTVNVFHILRGGLNFGLCQVLRNAYGYKWQSSSFVSSQRVRSGDGYEIEDDAYRKFVIPDEPTVYTGDIVATGASMDSALSYLHGYLVRNEIQLKNFVFVTLGCEAIEPILERWHSRCVESFPGYDRTLLVYIEGRFAVARDDSPVSVCIPGTDLLRNVELGSLHTPEFEYSQFEKMIVALEGCTIYDGGKKSFEPIHHLEEIRGFWARQLEWARTEEVSLLQEYHRRFSLADYFEDEGLTVVGTPERLAKRRHRIWRNIDTRDYQQLFRRFRWLWSDERLEWARSPATFANVCEKKLQYLDSHLG